MLHLFSGDTVARKQEAPLLRFPRFSWKFVLTALALTLVTTFVAGVILVVANRFSSSAPEPIVVQTNPVVVPAPAVVDVPNPLAQSTEPETVAPAVPTLFTPRWEEMGKVYNGDQVLALPIEWDRVVKFYGPYDGKELGIALPPATAKENIPLSRLVGYVPIGNGQVILYAYSNYRWSVEDPQGVTYWKDVVPASVVERPSP